MQIFVPYAEPKKVAWCLDSARLNKQILECRQILAAIDGTSQAWKNHPVVKMYKPYRDWLMYYMYCLDSYRASLYEYARVWNNTADKVRPPFINEAFCIQHRKRLYTKNSEHYKQFAEYGTSEENWYFDNETNQIIKYVNGKRI